MRPVPSRYMSASRRRRVASRLTLTLSVGTLALAALAWLDPQSSRAAEATPWGKGAHSEARLIDGGTMPAGSTTEPHAIAAGLEVRLDPAFITYWRDPGDAGVPPTFDFGGSTNLKSAEVRYPAPRRLDEAGAAAYGYEGDVTFPLVVVPADPTKPVRLRVDLAYAVCHDICLPAHAALAIDLDGAPSAEASRIRDALAAVPQRTAVGQSVGALAIVGLVPAADGLSVEAKAPPGSSLFVEAPDAWSFVLQAAVAEPDGRLLFPVKRVDGPADTPLPPLILTLVAPGDPPAAIEVRAQLDARPKTP